jgi:hypothetical protein
MDKIEIKRQLRRLRESEEAILQKLALDTNTDFDQIKYVIQKIWEMSGLILRLEKTLEEIRKNET